MIKLKYFKVHELVSKKVYLSYPESTIMARADTDALLMLDWIRELVGCPIVINNWKTGGPFQQRGFRSNIDQMVRDATVKSQLTLSAHNYFKAFDGSSANESKMSTEAMYDKILKNAHLAPCSFRMESKTATVNKHTKKVTWFHFDTCCDNSAPIGKKTCTIFNP